MASDLAFIVGVAAVAVMLGFLAAAQLVRRDLAPSIGLHGPRQIFLVAGLTFGVVAALIKIGVIVVLAHARTLAPSGPPAPLEAARDDLVAGAFQPQDWRALPGEASRSILPSPRLVGRCSDEPALSRDGTLTCASCHDLTAKGGADGRRVAVGVDGQTGTRNTPTVYNAAFQTKLFWDGRAGSLEEQALGPIVNPIEMAAESIEAALARIDTPDWRAAFARAFGPSARIDAPHLARALADFERTLITSDAPYDRFVRGEATALDARQKRGMARFDEIGCSRCHSGPNFSGASMFEPRRPFMQLMTRGTRFEATLGRDKGRAGPQAENGVWRIPSLRNVALTAPYLHDGSVSELKEAVRIMAELQARATLAWTGAASPPPAWLADQRRFEPTSRRVMTEEDVDDIVAFLNALTSERLAAASR
ncbi:MAG: c-type cytochrome [Rhizobiales bacterium]|nr:c-type cytochrome [Hyphomicrobiales bacterium]